MIADRWPTKGNTVRIRGVQGPYTVVGRVLRGDRLVVCVRSMVHGSTVLVHVGRLVRS